MMINFTHHAEVQDSVQGISVTFKTVSKNDAMPLMMEVSASGVLVNPDDLSTRQTGYMTVNATYNLNTRKFEKLSSANAPVQFMEALQAKADEVYDQTAARLQGFYSCV